MKPTTQQSKSCHRGSSTQEFYSAGRVTHSLGIHRRDRTFALLLLGRLGLWAGSLITANQPTEQFCNSDISPSKIT
jgi:hypothetical protein